MDAISCEPGHVIYLMVLDKKTCESMLIPQQFTVADQNAGVILRHRCLNCPLVRHCERCKLFDAIPICAQLEIEVCAGMCKATFRQIMTLCHRKYLVTQNIMSTISLTVIKSAIALFLPKFKSRNCIVYHQGRCRLNSGRAGRVAYVVLGA